MQPLITHVLGARPNFMKAAPVIRALAGAGHEQMLIHTGQHYDARMSDVFTELGLLESDSEHRTLMWRPARHRPGCYSWIPGPVPARALGRMGLELPGGAAT